jgi:sensor histidine kinase YesM
MDKKLVHRKYDYPCTPGLNLPFLMANLKSSFWLKLLLGLFMGALLALGDYLQGCLQDDIYFYDFGGAIIASYLIWSGSQFIGTYIDFKYDWEQNGLKKAFYLILSNIIFISICLTVIMQGITFIKGEPIPTYIYIESYMTSIVITTIINLIYISSSIFSYWKNTKYENEVLKKESLRSQLESLKNQVNPHFLFNSLNTLISIIDDEPSVAKVFTQKLADVYRYILQSREKDLVTLREELEFSEAYEFMLNIRYGANLNFVKKVPKTYWDAQIPPLVLQMLVENAIKHNVISSTKKLVLKIYVDDTKNLVVENNFQPKIINVESNKVGLVNISGRYQLLFHKDIEVYQNDEIFAVKLPLQI